MENFSPWSLKNLPPPVVLMKKWYILRQSTNQQLNTNINNRPQDSTRLYLSNSLILRKPHNLEEGSVDEGLGTQSSKSGKMNSQNLDGKGYCNTKDVLSHASLYLLHSNVLYSL